MEYWIRYGLNWLKKKVDYMENGYADLHIHTNESDGTFSPEEVLEHASECNLKAIAITDHDSVTAINPAVRIARQYGIEIIPGVELTTYTPDDIEIHILAYCFDYHKTQFLEKLDLLKKGRLQRAEEIISRLNKAGIDISVSDVTALSGKGAVGRMHIARALVGKKYVKTIPDAFRKYIGKGRIAYAKKWTLSPDEIMDFISSAGGISVLAHPGILGRDRLIPWLIKAGLQGLEVYHSNHSPTDVKRYISLAQKNNLIITGGSDCHGIGKGKTLIGKIKIPYHLVAKLKEGAGKQDRQGKYNNTGIKDGY